MRGEKSRTVNQGRLDDGLGLLMLTASRSSLPHGPATERPGGCPPTPGRFASRGGDGGPWRRRKGRAPRQRRSSRRKSFLKLPFRFRRFNRGVQIVKRGPGVVNQRLDFIRRHVATPIERRIEQRFQFVAL